jgi:bifunctional non-homologous end joining protein LigD
MAVKCWKFQSDDGLKTYMTTATDDGLPGKKFYHCTCQGFSMNGTCRHTRYIDQGIADKMSSKYKLYSKLIDDAGWVPEKVKSNFKDLPKKVKKNDLDSLPYPYNIIPTLAKKLKIVKLTGNSEDISEDTKEEYEDEFAPFSSALLPQLLTPVGEDTVTICLVNGEWGAQEKYNGKRIILDCRTDNVVAWNRKGKQCLLSPAVAEAARTSITPYGMNSAQGCVVDGELIGDTYYIFDLLIYCGKDLRDFPYKQRYTTLSGIGPLPYPGNPGILRVAPLARLSAEKTALYKKLKTEGREGIVFKRLDAPYQAGRVLTQYKYKFYETISCLVLGHNKKSSIQLGLYQDNKKLATVIYVGNCTVVGEKPPVGSVVEVKYLYAHKGGCLYQPSFIGIRDDVDADDLSKLKFKFEPEPESTDSDEEAQSKTVNKPIPKKPAPKEESTPPRRRIQVDW